MMPPRRWKLAKDVIIPKGSPVLYVGRMRRDVEHMVMVLVKYRDTAYEWWMPINDAIEARLIEQDKLPGEE